MITRPASEEDRAAVLALGLAERAGWFGEAQAGAEALSEWIDPEGGVAAGVVAVERDGRVAGFALPGRGESIFLTRAALPGHADRGLDDWREKERLCGSMFLARREGRPVGWVAGRLLGSGRGFVDTLAVATRERGRALLLYAFADLLRAGALGVEAGNEVALRLYRSVGLEVELEWRFYAGDG